MDFREIEGYEGLYSVNKKGDVISLLSKKILKKRLTACGYHTVALFKNKKRSEYKEHRLVAQAFIPNPENKLIINHINRVKNDNRVENLEWVTQRENVSHFRKMVGASFHKKCNKWTARIIVNGKMKNLGTFNCQTSAYLFRLKASIDYGIKNKYA